MSQSTEQIARQAAQRLKDKTDWLQDGAPAMCKGCLWVWTPEEVEDLRTVVNAAARAQPKTVAVSLDLTPEVVKEADYWRLHITGETVTVPKWVMDYLADSTRMSDALYDAIRRAYAAALAEKGGCIRMSGSDELAEGAEVLGDAELAAIQERCDGATPGPWFWDNPDDENCMNAYAVFTGRGGIDDFGPGYADHERIVAITMLQTPRYASHVAGRWEEDADFIANARADVPRLVAEVRRLRSALSAVRAQPQPLLIRCTLTDDLRQLFENDTGIAYNEWMVTLPVWVLGALVHKDWSVRILTSIKGALSAALAEKGDAPK